MISRQDIEDEAAMIERLGELQNPTGGDHTSTPWQAGGGHHILKADKLEPIATFDRTEDRDLALYFVNTHPAIIAMLRDQANAWDFARGATDNAPLQEFAARQAENLRIYADLFCRLGKVEDEPKS